MMQARALATLKMMEQNLNLKGKKKVLRKLRNASSWASGFWAPAGSKDCCPLLSLAVSCGLLRPLAALEVPGSSPVLASGNL